METETKKFLLPVVAAVAILVVMVVGATYAYFSVQTSNNFGTATIEAEAARVGSVALSAGTNLTMSLTADQMMKKGNDVSYWASSTGTKTTSTTETIGTAHVTGEGTYTCTYDLSITASGTNNMYTAFQGQTEAAKKAAGQIILTVNGTNYDFNTANLFPKTLTGLSMVGLTSASDQNITASLKVVNSNTIDQSALAGTDITISFSVSNFSCQATA